MTARTIRGGRGLGDSIYLRPVAEHFLRSGDAVTVLSDYPDIYLGLNVEVKRFTRFGVNVLAHYAMRKEILDTNQWEDICISAGVHPLPLTFKWKVRNEALVQRLRDQAAGRPIVVVHGGRVPMGRTDGFGKELLPEQAAFITVLRGITPSLLVRVGAADPVYSLPHDIDLNGSATVADLLDVASICHGVVGQCSFAIPLAEVFDKPLLIVWSQAGLDSREPYVARITPKKILSKATSWHVMDSWPEERIRQVTDRWVAMASRVACWPEGEHKCAS